MLSDCVCVCVFATCLSPQPVCVSLPSAVSLLWAPCLSLTKRGYLCPLFTAEERDTAHPPVPTHPSCPSFLFVFSPLFPNILLIFPLQGFTTTLPFTHTGGLLLGTEYILFPPTSLALALLSVMWSRFVCDRAVCSQIRERMCPFG